MEAQNGQSPIFYSSNQVNGVSEKGAIESMAPGVADAYLRLTGRREPVIPPGTPNIPCWRLFHWDSSKGRRLDCTQVLDDACQPGCFCDTKALRRPWPTHRHSAARFDASTCSQLSSISSNYSWTSADAYRFVNGYAATVGLGVSTTSTGTFSTRMSNSTHSVSSTQQGDYHGRYSPVYRYSNGSGESTFQVTPTASERSSVASQYSPITPHEAITPQLPFINISPRPATWHVPTWTDATTTKSLQDELPLECQVKMDDGMNTQAQVEKSIGAPSGSCPDVEAKKQSVIENENEDVFTGGICKQCRESNTAGLSSCDEEADLADGDVDGIYEDVYLTQVGEKLGKGGREQLAALQECTNTFKEKGIRTWMPPLPPPVTEATRHGGLYRVRPVLKRHRQLRPRQLGY